MLRHRRRWATGSSSWAPSRRSGTRPANGGATFTPALGLRLRPGHRADRSRVLPDVQRHGQRRRAGPEQHRLPGRHVHHGQRHHGQPEPRPAVHGQRPRTAFRRAGMNGAVNDLAAQRRPALRRGRASPRSATRRARRPGDAERDDRRARRVPGRRRDGEPQLDGTAQHGARTPGRRRPVRHHPGRHRLVVDRQLQAGRRPAPRPDRDGRPAPGAAVVDPDWRTHALRAGLLRLGVRLLRRATSSSRPDGTYFAVVTTGGGNAGTLCDTRRPAGSSPTAATTCSPAGPTTPAATRCSRWRSPAPPSTSAATSAG